MISKNLRMLIVSGVLLYASTPFAIYNGQLVTDRSDPVARSTVALIGPNGRAFCSAVIIGNKTLSSAAHCFEANEIICKDRIAATGCVPNFRVYFPALNERLGEPNPNRWTNSRQAFEATVPVRTPNRDREAPFDQLQQLFDSELNRLGVAAGNEAILRHLGRLRTEDVALMQLKGDIPTNLGTAFPNFAPIDIIGAQEKIIPDSQVTLGGFGWSRNRNDCPNCSGILYKGFVLPFSRQLSSRYLWRFYFVADSKNGAKVCSGDSGGFTAVQTVNGLRFIGNISVSSFFLDKEGSQEYRADSCNQEVGASVDFRILPQFVASYLKSADFADPILEAWVNGWAAVGQTAPSTGAQNPPGPTAGVISPQPANPPVQTNPVEGQLITTVEEFLTKAAAGGTVRLAAGLFRLPKTLVLAKDVEIIGAGMTKTRIVSAVSDQVIKYEGTGNFKLKDLTVEHEGKEAANVILVLGGNVTFDSIVLRGSIYDPTRDLGGAGGRIVGDAIVKVTQSRFEDNERGILLRQNAKASIEKSTFQRNQIKEDKLRGVGISVRDSAEAIILFSEFLSNDVGVYAGQSSRVQIRSSTFRQHQKYWGIIVTEYSTAEIENNILRFDGIGFGQNATGTIRGNNISSSTTHGIWCDGSSGPTIIGNTIEDSSGYGIFLAKTSKAKILSNTLKGNKQGDVGYGDK